MLSLEKRKIKTKAGTSARYYIRGTCPYTGERVRESLGTGDKGTASQLLAREVEKRRQRGLHGDVGGATFAECVVHYLGKGGSDRFLDPILDAIGTKPMREITDKVVSDLASSLYPTAKAATIVRQVYAPIEAVVNEACRADPPLATPRKFQKPYIQKAPPKYAKDDRDLEAILMAIPDPRRRAGVLFMSFSGARASEVARVVPDDYDPKAGTITLVYTKNDDPRVVALPPFVNEVVSMIDRSDRYQRLFGFPSRFAIYKEVKSAAKRAGVPFLSPHKLGRHTFAARFLRSGNSLASLQKAGGWRSVNAVMVYAHLEQSEVDRAIRNVSTSLATSHNAPNTDGNSQSLNEKPLLHIGKSE